jgi:hypothetical protein
VTNWYDFDGDDDDITQVDGDGQKLQGVVGI